jgi:hypothetical protein
MDRKNNMRLVTYYSHLNGLEWLLVHQKPIWKEIQNVIATIDADAFRTKISLEKTMRGKSVFSPKELNREFTHHFKELHWQESRTSYWVTDDAELIRNSISLPRDEQKAMIESAGKKPIFSYNQTDFVKNRVAVEVQFGKYSFIAYDLFVKHLAFYVRDAIDVGVEILPMKEMQERMSSGPGYYEGALYDVVRQGRGVPSVPLVLIGVAP